MGIESVSGKDKVVVETLQYFFSSTVVIDLSARITENMIEKEVIPQKHYNQIEVGYNSFEYLKVGGLSEYNTKSGFTTVISVLDNKLDLVSKYRADTQGIVNLRREAATDEDVKGDEDNYIIDSLRRTTPYTGFMARTSEGFTLVTGGADADNSFNLRLTPKRNLLRHGQLIRAGLEHELGSSLRWQASDKNTTLVTEYTTDVNPYPLPAEQLYPLAENADVLVNNLAASFFCPEIYSIDVTLNYAELSTILANQKGLIKLSSDKYGWIMQLTMGAKENKASLRLLRANLNVVTPA
jgi:hypothetical protein